LGGTRALAECARPAHGNAQPIQPPFLRTKFRATKWSRRTFLYCKYRAGTVCMISIGRGVHREERTQSLFILAHTRLHTVTHLRPLRNRPTWLPLSWERAGVRGKKGQKFTSVTTIVFSGLCGPKRKRRLSALKSCQSCSSGQKIRFTVFHAISRLIPSYPTPLRESFRSQVRFAQLVPVSSSILSPYFRLCTRGQNGYPLPLLRA